MTAKVAVAERPPADEFIAVHRASSSRPPLEAPALASAGWANLGSWTDTTDYPRAAEALAHRVGSACGLSANDVVVDYGCGYGDSLRLWVEAFGVQRVLGVEPDAQTVRVAQARVQAWGLAQRISVVAGRAESLAPRALTTAVTAVVSVDAAYHFRTRAAWLARVGADLPDGGRVAWSDLAFHGAAARSLGLRAAASLVGIPRENLSDANTLRSAAVQAGLRDVELQSCGEEVLDGFLRATHPRGLRPAITRLLLRVARRRGLVDYVITSAGR